MHTDDTSKTLYVDTKIRATFQNLNLYKNICCIICSICISLHFSLPEITVEKNFLDRMCSELMDTFKLIMERKLLAL